MLLKKKVNKIISKRMNKSLQNASQSLSFDLVVVVRSEPKPCLMYSSYLVTFSGADNLSQPRLSTWYTWEAGASVEKSA